MLPDFVIIGAPKAGTTWLASCLRQHPGVFLPQQEIHYWTGANATDAVHAAYEQRFAGAASGQLIGERSNSYLITPGTAEVIFRNMPHVKLVAILRNPIDRSYSGYCMRLRNREVNCDVNLFLDPERSPCPDILKNSLYCEHLKPYVACFPKSQICFLIFDDIEARPKDVLTGLSHFLGIEPLIDQMFVAEKINAKEKSRLPPTVVRFLRRHESLQHLSRAVRNTSISQMMRSLLRRQTSYPPLAPALRARMAAYFRTDVEQLSNLVGRDLTSWVSETPIGVRNAASTNPAIS